MGTPEFAVPSLTILLENGYTITAVVTAPDKPRGRGQQHSPTPIKAVADERGLRVLQPASLRDPAFADALRSLKPDLLVVVAFRILPREIFSIPQRGAFNLHASLLPRYRGAAPINWAIINGETETGVSTFFLQEKVDTGNLLLQARVPIRAADTAGTLHDTLATVGAEIVLHTVRLIEQGKVHPRPQDDSLASPAPKIFKDDCNIIWDHSAARLSNFIRGLSPVPGAFTRYEGKVLKIFASEVLSDNSKGPPGTVAVTPSSLAVATGDKMLSLIDLQQEGKKRMPVEEFLRGFRIQNGDRLE